MDQVLSVSEAARALEVSSQTVRGWADKGILPAMKTGGGQRILQRVDVDRVRRERQNGNEAA